MSCADDQFKVPPHSIEAEQAVLGCLLLESKAWEKLAGKLQSSDFYRRDHRLIFEAIFDLTEAQKPVDTLTVSDLLQQRSQLSEVGGEAYLFELAQKTPSTQNILTYAEVVDSRSILRKVIACAQSTDLLIIYDFSWPTQSG